MHIHNVYFWLQAGLDKNQLAEFEQGLSALCDDTAVTAGYYGVPAPSDRAVVDSSYSFALVLIFQDTGKHDQYQIGTVHQQFLDVNAAKWTRVQVYDLISLD